MVRRWVLLLLTFQTAATAQEAKLAQELQAARRAVDELKSNLNEQWFEFWSQKTIPSEGLVRRCRGVVFRSKDCFYCSFTRRQHSDSHPRGTLIEWEALIVDGYLIFKDHRHPEHAIHFRVDSVSHALAEVQSVSDILRLFRSRVEKFIDLEFAVPAKLGAAGELHVTYDPHSTHHTIQKLELTKSFSVALHQENGQYIPHRVDLIGQQHGERFLLGFVEPSFERIGDRAILTGIYSEGRQQEPSEQPEVHEFWTQTIPRPNWVLDGQLKLTAHSESVFKLLEETDFEGSVADKVPEVVLDHVVEIPVADMQERHSAMFSQINNITFQFGRRGKTESTTEPIAHDPETNWAGHLLLICGAFLCAVAIRWFLLLTQSKNK